jgi:hypothetical protein
MEWSKYMYTKADGFRIAVYRLQRILTAFASDDGKNRVRGVITI